MSNLFKELEVIEGDTSYLITIYDESAHTKIGQLSELDTENKSNLVSAINEILSDVNSKIGVLTNLNTTDKSNLVSAINEVLESLTNKIGNLSSLNTTDKSNIVSAINEINTKLTNLTIKVNNSGLINVKDYGAIGDGITDDTTAIQSALTNNPDCTIYFPTGVYKITSPLSGNDVNIVGDGQQTSILLFGGDINGLVLTQRDEGIYSDCITVHDISICNDGMGKTALSIGGTLLADRWQISPIIYNVYIGQFSSSAYLHGWTDGIVIANCNGASIHDCSIKGSINTNEPDYKGNNGIYISSNTEPHGTDYMINNVMITMFHNGINADTFEGLSIDNSRIVGCNIGVYINPTLAYPYVSVIGCHINASIYSIYAKTIKEIIVQGCDLYCQLSAQSDVWNIYLLNLSHGTIIGNIFNNLSNVNLFPIELDGNTEYCIISNNVINNQSGGTITYAMSLGSSTHDNYIVNNIIKSSTINDAGTDNTKTGNI